MPLKRVVSTAPEARDENPTALAGNASTTASGSAEGHDNAMGDTGEGPDTPMLDAPEMDVDALEAEEAKYTTLVRRVKAKRLREDVAAMEAELAGGPKANITLKAIPISIKRRHKRTRRDIDDEGMSEAGYKPIKVAEPTIWDGKTQVGL